VIPRRAPGQRIGDLDRHPKAYRFNAAPADGSEQASGPWILLARADRIATVQNDTGRVIDMVGSASVPRLRQVVLDCIDARALAEFYRHLLELVYRPGDEPPEPGGDDERGRDWLVLRTPDGVPQLAFQQVVRLPEATWPDGSVPQQLHLDLTVESIEDLQLQHERVLRLGGRLLHDRSDDPEEPLRVYADPAGHPFCIFVA
jgi:hypothetical protein